jgi:hypothetical protein
MSGEKRMSGPTSRGSKAGEGERSEAPGEGKFLASSRDLGTTSVGQRRRGTSQKTVERIV